MEENGPMSKGLKELDPELEMKDITSSSFEIDADAIGVRGRIKKYQEMRIQTEKEWFVRLMLICGRSAMAGGGLLVVGGVASAIGSSYAALSLTSLGLLSLAGSLIMIASCPFEEGVDGCVVAVSFNELALRNQRAWFAGLLFYFLLGIALGYGSYPYTPCAIGFLNLIAMIRFQPVLYDHNPLSPTSLAALVGPMTLGFWGPCYIFEGLRSLGVAMGANLIALGMFRIIFASSIVVWWAHYNKKTRKLREVLNQQEKHQADNMLAAFASIFFFAIGSGIAQIWDSVLAFGFPEQYNNAVLVGIEGAIQNTAFAAVYLASAGIVAFLGRKTCHKYMRLLFEDSRAKFDGAFVAELLETVKTPSTGAFWYILRNSADTRYNDDHRKFWKRGIIESQDGHQMIVRTLDDTSKHIIEATTEPSMISRVILTLANQDASSSEDLLIMAEKELRCIDWKNIDLELMTGSILGVGAVDITKLLSRGRRVRPGERIDFFMSHSWKDNEVVKFEALQVISQRFKKKHNRFPTFWLDKVCIDQSNISDGLKVLPINVMACDKMLILCGSTYASRLWCVWELFVLFSFSSEDKARQKVEFVPLLGKENTATVLLDSLKQFSMTNAHCFDPNEEARLRNIISARGETEFQDRIRQLAFLCEKSVNGGAARPAIQLGIKYAPGVGVPI